MFISTKRLLENAVDAKIIHADGSYKVTTEKLPLIVIGCSDAVGQFHLIGLMITSHESADAYALAFHCMKTGILKITGKEIKPSYLMADADPAIHNGFRKIFGDGPEILMCYAHVLGNVQRKYKFNDTENKEKIKEDLRQLHLSANEDIFDAGCDLFSSKWIEKERNITQKLKKSFFTKNKKWYIGSTSRTPKTNNLLERFNGTMKTFQTYHRKLPLKQFISVAIKIVSQ